MKKEDVLARLKTVLAEKLDVDEEKIVAEALFVEDLQADSLDIVEIIMGIEEEFDIEIPDDEAEKLLSVGEAMKFVLGKLDIEDR